jgi:hypothetical protein
MAKRVAKEMSLEEFDDCCKWEQRGTADPQAEAAASFQGLLDNLADVSS